MSINISSVAQFGTELTATMTGAWAEIGVIPAGVAILIFDNQGTASVAISVNGGTSTWKTFTPGQGLVLDVRAQQGKAPNFSFRQSTTFYGNGASGTFSISYVYAETF